jgi:flagellar hook-associated protein 2
VAFKQDSLQDRITDFETQIEQMEARLERRMVVMIRRFVAMEIALSKIQNQSTWLAGQITAASGVWG